ncbi:hypothetical protein TBS_12210 [Thermobispora bispora]|jgi:hypothetical protein|uniref:Uncharacterized protein n=1 Tax=Thermobispora bispora (strain ATCC 19993 / DSM 43833 / CBS 139.67 / JCM 10125 / KCTC 9307 / NBRC 14880 / R51) TaxID=469371 RepID=D6Y355_THEBD|nr:hypothetical protein [Thermobispora bispora]ADG88930.1 hypothetical protein Tbis_2220 [Thermobispora bispora DSM 43833]MDI9580706.1 hypothetical protein [Thermobispora sp.]
MGEEARPALMLKVIPPKLLVPYLSGRRTFISGYVYRAQDCDHLATPADYVAALDLGFTGSELTPEVPELYILRWRAHDVDTYTVPYGPLMGGDWHDRPPFTGTGFTSSREHVIPQFHTMPMPIPAGAEIVHLTAAGARPFAVFDGLTWRPAG